MNKKKIILSILVAVFLIASGLATLTLATAPAASTGSSMSTSTANVVNQISPASASSPTTGSASAGYASTNGAFHTNAVSPTTSSVIAAAQAQGVPLRDLYVPAYHSAPNIHNGIVMPGYSQEPAPFGIGSYGIRNVSGTLQAFNYTTNGFQANLNVSDLSMNYLNSFDPNGLTVQLNTILTGASVKGMTGFTYWTQNVAFYDSYAHQFQMIDNIWNFSSPSSGMPGSTIYNSTAPSTQSFSSAYIGVGNLVNNVSAPFNLTLTLQTGVYGGMSAVYFNYSITFTNTSTGKLTTIGGVFDRVLFNSLTGVQGYSASKSVFRVDGSTYNPTGFIPYDAEVTIEGPGGGSNVNVGSITGNMTLHYNNSAGNYVNVPSAYNVGSETGETSTGIAEAWSSNGVVRLSSGPSMIYGMWNISSSTGTTHYTGTLSPSNAFMFVAPGNSISVGPTDYSQYGYVPMTTSGDYSFYLPSGTYYQKVMLSDYAIEQGALGTHESITIAYDAAAGVFTPLYAMNNAQLANISFSGAGTLANPYVGFNNQAGYINPLFGMYSDYGFPVFSGMFLQNTNAYIDFNNSSSFQIMYQQSQSLLYMGALYGMGALDYLNYVLYNTSNVSIYNAPMISGTLPWSYYVATGYTGSMILWNSTNDLIANSTFLQGTWMPYGGAMFIYNPQYVVANNTIVGNNFLDEFEDFGIFLASSGNLFYNNAFNFAYNIGQWNKDPWTGAPAAYVNTWNVTPTATSAFSLAVNGYTLSGNILGNSTMGGNYWNNYASSQYPFSDSGGILIGGDYAPIVLPGPYYPFWFIQQGLNAGQTWSVTLGGVTHSSTTSTVMFMVLPYTSFNYSVQTTGSLVSFYGPTTGTAYSYPDLNLYGFYYTPVFTVTVTQTGLPNGFLWESDMNDAAFYATAYNSSTTNQLTLTYAPGEYLSFNSAIGNYFGFSDSSIYAGSEYLVPLFTDISITEAFTTLYNSMYLSFNNLPTTASWTVTMYEIYHNGTEVNAGTFTGPNLPTPSGVSSYITLPYGYYSMVFNSPGYVLSGNNPYNVPFNPSAGTFDFYALNAIPATFNFQGLPSGTGVSIYLSASGPGYNWNNFVSTTSSSLTVMVPVSSSGLNYYAISSNSAYTMSSTQSINLVGNYVATYGLSSVTVNVPFYLVPAGQSTVTFSESGLSSGATWQVTLNGQLKTATAGSTIVFTVPTGTYSYQVSSAGMVSPQASATLNVQSATQSVSVSFSPQTYSVTFIVAGLPVNQSLNVTFNGQTQTTTGAGLVFNASAGTYNFSVGSVNGYTLSSNATSVNINHNTVVVLTFTPVKSSTAALLMYLGYAGLVGLGALGGVLGALFIPKAMGGKKGGS